VPLRRVDWSWSADAQRSGVVWSIVPGSSVHSKNPDDFDTTEHPQWSINVQHRGWENDD